MTPHALVVSRSIEVNDLFRSTLDKARVKVECCLRPSEATLRLNKSRFDAIVFDCDHEESALDVLSNMRRGKSNRSSIAIAVVNGNEQLKAATRAGANFVLTRPLFEEPVLRCVRAAHALVLRELRRYHRQTVNTTAHLKHSGQLMQAQVGDVSEGGLSLLMLHRPDTNMSGPIRLRFTLPECAFAIEGMGEVAWTQQGKLGIRFLQLAPSSRDELNRWLTIRMDRSPLAVAAAKGARALAR